VKGAKGNKMEKEKKSDWKDEEGKEKKRWE